MSKQEESDITCLLECLGTHPDHGLSQVEAYNRLRRYGTNEIERPYMRYVVVRSAALFCVAVGMVIALKGMFLYALGAIGMAVCLMCLASVLQYRYKKKAASSPSGLPGVCSAIRGDRLLQLPVYKLVPGDIVRIESGEIIPADGRLTQALDLVIQEKTISGDPEPITKDALCSEDWRNRVFMGTIVVSGRGAFVVTETGMRTQIGRIRARTARGKYSQ